MLENGATYGGRNNQIWAPITRCTKSWPGSRLLRGRRQREGAGIAKGMGLWVVERLNHVPTETRIRMWNRYIAGEYGGMNEVMARLYRITKDCVFSPGRSCSRTLDFFYGNVNRSAQVCGECGHAATSDMRTSIFRKSPARLETFRDSQPVYFRIAQNFWDMATNSYMYSIGGVAGGRRNAECFTAEPDALWQNGFVPGGKTKLAHVQHAQAHPATVHVSAG